MQTERLNEIKTTYLAALTDGADLTGLCNITAHYTGIPVAITLATRTIIAKSSDYTSDLVDEFMNHMKLSSEAEAIERENDVQRHLLSRRAMIGTYPFMRYKHINCGCFRNRSMLAVLDCPVINRINMEEAIEIIEMAAPIFLTALKLGGYITDDVKYPMQSYLNGLLKEDDRHWFQQQYLYTSPLFNITAWKIGWFLPVTEDASIQTKQILDRFCSRRDYFWYAAYDKGFVLLYESVSHKALEQLAERMEGLCQICVSDDYSDLNETKNHVALAQLVLRIAQYEDNTDVFVFVHKYKIITEFLAFKTNFNKQWYENSLMAQIKKYDEEHSSQYYQTLRAYLLCERNYNAMAEKMFVHKNTVVYRMQRMTELFNLNLKDCRLITELYLSLFHDFQ